MSSSTLRGTCNNCRLATNADGELVVLVQENANNGALGAHCTYSGQTPESSSAGARRGANCARPDQQGSSSAGACRGPNCNCSNGDHANQQYGQTWNTHDHPAIKNANQVYMTTIIHNGGVHVHHHYYNNYVGSYPGDANRVTTSQGNEECNNGPQHGDQGHGAAPAASDIEASLRPAGSTDDQQRVDQLLDLNLLPAAGQPADHHINVTPLVVDIDQCNTEIGPPPLVQQDVGPFCSSGTPKALGEMPAPVQHRRDGSNSNRLPPSSPSPAPGFHRTSSIPETGLTKSPLSAFSLYEARISAEATGANKGHGFAQVESSSTGDRDASVRTGPLTLEALAVACEQIFSTEASQEESSLPTPPPLAPSSSTRNHLKSGGDHQGGVEKQYKQQQAPGGAGSLTSEAPETAWDQAQKLTSSGAAKSSRTPSTLLHQEERSLPPPPPPPRRPSFFSRDLLGHHGAGSSTSEAPAKALEHQFTMTGAGTSSSALPSFMHREERSLPPPPPPPRAPSSSPSDLLKTGGEDAGKASSSSKRKRPWGTDQREIVLALKAGMPMHRRRGRGAFARVARNPRPPMPAPSEKVSSYSSMIGSGGAAASSLASHMSGPLFGAGAGAGSGYGGHLRPPGRIRSPSRGRYGRHLAIPTAPPEPVSRRFSLLGGSSSTYQRARTGTGTARGAQGTAPPSDRERGEDTTEATSPSARGDDSSAAGSSGVRWRWFFGPDSS